MCLPRQIKETSHVAGSLLGDQDAGAYKLQQTEHENSTSDNFILFLFIHYLNRTAHLAEIASLPYVPLKHIYIYTNIHNRKMIYMHYKILLHKILNETNRRL